MRDPVIVTGSEAGIGRATAVALARAGHDVGVAWHADGAGAAGTAAAVRAAGASAVVRRLDPGDRPAESIEELAVALGGLWGIVGCAGAAERAGTLDETADGWRRALAVGLTGPFLCAQAAARRLVAAERGGRIVLVMSVHDAAAREFAAASGAAAAGLRVAAETMALELAPFRVTVDAVGPDRGAAAIARLLAPDRPA
jgi:NAD(P)-dependent dehydrogenase (short-subunit alcohol dehydrogenase family)